jgi:hypothetical protein
MKKKAPGNRDGERQQPHESGVLQIESLRVRVRMAEEPEPQQNRCQQLHDAHTNIAASRI